MTKNVQVRRGVPGDPFDQLFENVFPTFFRPVRLSEMGEGVVNLPHVDIIDRDQNLVVRAEIAGVEKDKLNVEVHGNQVFISGERSDESKQEEGKYVYRERRFGSFSRTIQLPEDVNGAEAQASYRDGILELVLPKVEAAKRKKIEIGD